MTVEVQIKTTVSASVDEIKLAEVLIENPHLLAAVFTEIADRTRHVKSPLEEFGAQLAASSMRTRIAFATVHDAMRHYARQNRTFEPEEEDVEGAILAAKERANG